jgi:hypothetical protein
MCLPLAIIGGALMAAGAGAQYFGQKKADHALTKTFNSERDRQHAFEADQVARFQDSLDGVKGMTDPAAQAAAASNRLNAFKAVTTDANPIATGYLPGVTSAPSIVKTAGERAGAKANAATASLSQALANMSGFGDLQLANNIDIGRNSQSIGQIGGFMRGSLDALQPELDAAKQKGGNLRMLGSLAQSIGQLHADRRHWRRHDSGGCQSVRHYRREPPGRGAQRQRPLRARIFIMARGSNFYYAGDQQLGAKLGATLGRALFGDPEAAAKLALQKAQMGEYAAQANEANAHAGLYGEQTTGEKQKNTGSQRLSDLIAGLSAPPQQTGPVDPLAVLPPAGPTADQVKAALPTLLSAMVMARGDTVPVAETLSQLPAYFGDDELARRSMIAQGHTPDKDFAVTPERADTIARQGYNARYITDTDVARINHASDMPIANIESSDRRRGQDLEHGDRMRGQDLGRLGKTIGFSLVSDVLPGAQMTSGERDPAHNREVGGVSDSYHLPGDGVEAFDIKPGTGARTFADAKAAMQAKYGNRLVEAIDETHRPGHSPHWHFAVADTPGGKTAAAKAPKQVSAASEKMLSGLISSMAKAQGYNLDPGARANMLTSAAKLYQQSGNPNDAVGQVFGALKHNIAARQGGQPGNVNEERQRAQRAIANGAPRSQVAQLFKQRTGQSL